MISDLSKMSHKSNESDDEFLSSDHIGSPLIDDGGFGGSIDDHIVLKKGPWTSVEDAILVDYVRKHGEGNWSSVQKHSGLSRCGKSCRLRWANHLRPNLKKGSFTLEEERLIIELHSKMGNKWARMAANLPGRTDNEIKNYWNTRIKRRQRAGLPLYPPELCLEALNESKENNKFPSENVPHNIVHSSRHEIPDVMFDGLNGNYGGSAYVAELCDVSSHSMPTKGLGSSQYTTSPQPIVRRQKRTRQSAEALSWCGNRTRNESETTDLIPDGIGGNMVTQSVGLSSPYNPDPVTMDFSLFSDRQGNHFPSNGKFSASEPADGVVKLELPSLQYPDADFSIWDSSPAVMLESMDAFIQSPPSGTLQTGCHSPQNSGLLDALLNEANTRKSVKGQLFSKRLNSYVITPMDISGSGLDLHETKQEETADSTIATRNAPALDKCETKTANYGNSGAALSSDCAAANIFRSMLDDYPHAEAFPGKSLKPEVAAHTWTCDGHTREPSTQFDRLRPDALLGSCWLGQNVVCPKDQAIPPHAMEADFGGLSNDYWHTAYGSALSQGWGFGSCSWNNMPAVCQMSDLP